MERDACDPSIEVGYAWAAGFFDGEGSFIFKPARPQTKANIYASVPQNHPEVLERFVVALGYDGEVRVNGPYNHGMYQAQFFGVHRTRDVAAKMWPYLGSVKRAQFESVEGKLLAERDDFFRLRGDECRRGHTDWAETPRGRVCRRCRNDRNAEYKRRRKLAET